MLVSDQELISKSCAGDIDAFEELVKRYEQKIYTVAYRLVGNHADASDMAQEAFIKIYRALPKFRGESSLKTWMYHIVSNTCRDELRKKKVKIYSIHEPLETEEGRVYMEHRNTEKEPEEVILELERQSEIQACLNQLTEEHRLILVLRELQDFSYEEIASQLKCTLGTVKSRLSRARLAFRDVYMAIQNGKQDRLETGKEGDLWIAGK